MKKAIKVGILLGLVVLFDLSAQSEDRKSVV